MFGPDNVSVPAADFCRAPKPDTTPAYVSAPVRSNFRVPEFTTLCVAIEPVPPPAPTLTMPAEIVNTPSKVLAPDNVKVPLPCLVSLPLVPSITPANVASELPAVVNVFAALVELSVTLAAESVVSEVAIDATVSSHPAKLKVALLLTMTADELAILFDAPNASTPSDTVVAPV